VVHRKLVDAYVSKCGGEFGSLPNDNYIFWFLGYHLYKGGCSHLFPQIYLNLNFIAAKLRATGPSDLLNDFRKYVDYISGKVRKMFLSIKMNDYLTKISYFLSRTAIPIMLKISVSLFEPVAILLSSARN
jgi:APAF-1 helical domain